MRIIQLIDSLHPGGAERMAVSYANAFLKREGASYLCCTREEGSLTAQILPGVSYLFLKKRNSLDLSAFWRLRNFIKTHKIEIIHAHGTSWFIGAVMKFLYPKVTLIWHDHFGREMDQRRVYPLKFFSRSFDGIISVNEELADWARKKLKVKNVIFVKNFLPLTTAENRIALKGDPEALKIICLANLRPQKDHFSLIKAFSRLQSFTQKKLSLHLVGKDLGDNYSAQVHQLIDSLANDNIFIYGEKSGIDHLLNQGDIGVLSSVSEGLPVALLEYGKAGLPVVCTRVGQCAKVIGNSGRLVPSGNIDALAKALFFYVNDERNRTLDGKEFQKKVCEEFSEDKILPKAQSFFRKLSGNNSGEE